MKKHQLLTVVLTISLGACGGQSETDSGDTTIPGGGAHNELPSTPDNTPTSRPDLEQFIRDLPVLTLPQASSTQTRRQEEEVREGEVNTCVYTTISETSHAKELVSFDPNADTLWPGALVQAESLSNGLLTPIGVARAPGTITLTNVNISDPRNPGPIYSRTISAPTHASTQEAIHDILNSGTVDTAAKISYTKHQASSLDEGVFKAKLAAKFGAVSLEATFGRNWMTHKTTYLVDFTQSYYTVSFETPQNSASIFAPSVTVNSLRPYMSSGNPPGYISSVTYGRRLLIKVESNESSTKLEAALNAAFANKGSVELSLEQRQTLENSKMTALILGGPARTATNITEFGQDKAPVLQKYIQEGANYSAQSPGVPLSFTVRYLRDNQLLTVASATSFTVPSCTGKRSTVSLTLNNLYVYDDGDWLGKGEIGYNIYFVDGGNEQPLVSGDRTRRGKGDTIELNWSKLYSFPQREGASFAIKLHVYENKKNATTKKEHTFNLSSRNWSPSGPTEMVAENGNLRVGLRYKVEPQ